MTLLLAGFLYLLAIGLALLMLRQYARGVHDLLSLRNVALAGFIVFQVTSGAQALRHGVSGEFALHDPVVTGIAYVAWTTVFLGVFLWSYRNGLGAPRLAALPSPVRTDTSERSLWIFAWTSLLAGLVLVATPIPLVSLLTSKIGLALLAIAAGLGGWNWARRPLRPATIGATLAVLAAGVFIALMSGFGRRPLVAVSGCFLFGAYFSAWRYLSATGVLRRLGLVAVPAVLMVAMFTAARGGLRDRDVSPLAQIKAVASANPIEGLSQLADGQGTAVKSMWLMENFPERYDHRPLSTLQYAFYFPVPRSWWKGKPETLSMDLPHLANVRDVNRDVLTLGPGAIGHAAADGGFLVLILYAALAGALLRFADDVIVRHATQPLVVLPVASALGQVLGMARGEAGIFASILAISVVGSWVFSAVASRLLVRIGLVASDAAIGSRIADYREEFDHIYYGSPETDPDPPTPLPLEVLQILRGEREDRRAA